MVGEAWNEIGRAEPHEFRVTRSRSWSRSFTTCQCAFKLAVPFELGDRSPRPLAPRAEETTWAAHGQGSGSQVPYFTSSQATFACSDRPGGGSCRNTVCQDQMPVLNFQC